MSWVAVVRVFGIVECDKGSDHSQNTNETLRKVSKTEQPYKTQELDGDGEMLNTVTCSVLHIIYRR